MREIEILSRLLREGQREEDWRSLAQHDKELWNRVYHHLINYGLAGIPVDKFSAFEKLIAIAKGAADFYLAFLENKNPIPHDDLYVFAIDALKSYPRNEDEMQAVCKWASTQRLQVVCDQIIADGNTYHRILSRSWIPTQTSVSGVVYRRSEVIDVPAREVVTLAKALERTDQLLEL